MRVQHDTRDVVHSGHGRTVQAKIKATRKLFSFFSDGVYSNKPVAICRELVANAIDSHVAAGCGDRPVEVTLPTEMEPTFMVQDFGTGMSEDFVFEKYLVYAEGSTKDENDQAIGGFGIGKAAVFSYTDQFSLVSVQDGVKSVYSVFIDSEGIPAITQVAQTTTDEPNGVAISFPVEQDDVKTFHEAVQTALQFFMPLPTVRNGTLVGPTYNYLGKGWALRPTSGDLGVIMGGIRYPVNSSNLTWALRGDAKLSPLLSYGLDLTMPIGSCGVALSREALSYDGKTSENIRDALAGLIDDVVATFATMFDNCTTMWEAIVALHKETNGATANTGRAKLMAANAFWKGAKIEDHISVQHRGDIGTCWMIEPISYRRRLNTTVGNAKWENIQEQYNLYPGKISHVIVDDLPQSSKSKQIMKIKAFVEDETDQSKHILVLRAGPDNTDATAIQQMLNKIGMPTEVTYTSSFPEPAAVAATIKVAGVAYVRPRVRMFTYKGTCDYFGNAVTNLTPGWAKLKDDVVAEIKYADQPTSGIMVVMSNFELPGDLRKMCDSGLLKWDELRFVNEGDAPKIKAHFELYSEVFETRKKAALAKYPQLAQRLALFNNSDLSDVFELVKETVGAGTLTLTPAQQARPFGRIVALWKEFVEPLDQEQHKLAAFVTPVLPPRCEPDKLVAAFSDKQAEAKILLTFLDRKEAKHLALISKNL